MLQTEHSNLGVNAIKPGVVAVTIGTSGAVRVVTDKPTIDPKGRVFCYALTKDKWVVGGPVNNGGIVFRWVRDQLFAPEKVTADMMNMDSYDLLTQIAKKFQLVQMACSSTHSLVANGHQSGTLTLVVHSSG